MKALEDSKRDRSKEELYSTIERERSQLTLALRKFTQIPPNLTLHGVPICAGLREQIAESCEPACHSHQA